MIPQIVHRVIRGADDLHIVMTHESASGELGVVLQAVVAGIVDLASRFGVQALGDAEGGLQCVQW